MKSTTLWGPVRPPLCILMARFNPPQPTHTNTKPPKKKKILNLGVICNFILLKKLISLHWLIVMAYLACFLDPLSTRKRLLKITSLKSFFYLFDLKSWNEEPKYKSNFDTLKGLVLACNQFKVEPVWITYPHSNATLNCNYGRQFQTHPIATPNSNVW